MQANELQQQQEQHQIQSDADLQEKEMGSYLKVLRRNHFNSINHKSAQHVESLAAFNIVEEIQRSITMELTPPDSTEEANHRNKPGN